MNQIIKFLRRPVFQSTTNRMKSRRRFLANRQVSLSSKRNSLLRLLSVAHRERLDVGMLVSNLSDEYTGSYRWRLQRVAQLISSGTPVNAALEQSPETLSKQQLLTLQFAEQTGTLPEAFDSLLAETRAVSTPRVSSKSIFDSVMYAGIVSLLMMQVVTFLLTWLGPTYVKMAEELGFEVNESLQGLIGFGNWISSYWPLVFIGIALLVAVLMSTRVRGFLSRLGLVRWLSPGTRSRGGELLQMLAITCDSGRPLPAALSTLGRFHFDPVTRHKVLLARNEIEQGEPVWKSLADAKLIRPSEAEGLAELPDGKSQAWALRQIAEVTVRQSDRRAKTWHDLILPGTILVLAPFVAWIGFAIMQFLNHLVTSLA